MSEGSDGREPSGRPTGSLVGIGFVVGAGIGTAVFAAADNPVWVGVGAGIGFAVAAAVQSLRR